MLGEHPALREAAVVAREQAPGDWRLVAFVVVHGAAPPASGELRSFLQRRLPGYMIPAQFVPLDALPRTPNGKVDRGKLQGTASPERPATPAAPRTAVEGELVELWTDLLGLDLIGIDESFFDVGGHSLLAARLLSRVRSHFQVDLPLRLFFDDPTVAGLALAVTAALVERAGTGQADRLRDLLAAPAEAGLERQGQAGTIERSRPE